MVIENIITGFHSCLDKLKNKGVISSNSLMRYWDYNVHSYLQYCFIEAAENAGLMGIPEYKLRLSKPIDKHDVDPRLKDRKTRYIRTIRVDVGFLEKGRLVGIGEVYTPDEIHGCLSSKQLEDPWVTPYNKLIHIVKHEKDIESIILAVGLWTLPQWKDAKKKTLQGWYRCWKEVVKHLSRYKRVAVAYIKDLDDVETEILSST